MKKTETITFRVTPAEKKLISNLAWVQRLSVSDALVFAAQAEMRKLKESGYLMLDDQTLDLMYDIKSKRHK